MTFLLCNALCHSTGWVWCSCFRLNWHMNSRQTPHWKWKPMDVLSHLWTLDGAHQLSSGNLYLEICLWKCGTYVLLDRILEHWRSFQPHASRSAWNLVFFVETSELKRKSEKYLNL